MQVTTTKWRKYVQIGEYRLKPHNILSNNIVLPGEFNPHRVGLYIIGNEYGPLVAVWASHEQDALDEATDAGKLNSFLMSAEDQAEYEREGWDVAYLGNAGEAANLDYAWIHRVTHAEMTPALIERFRRRRYRQ